MTDSFNTRTTLHSSGQAYEIRSLAALDAKKVARLPYSLKILLENLLRFEDGTNVTRADIEALLNGAGLAAGRPVTVPPAFMTSPTAAATPLSVRIWQAHAPRNVFSPEIEVLA